MAHTLLPDRTAVRVEFADGTWEEIPTGSGYIINAAADVLDLWERQGSDRIVVVSFRYSLVKSVRAVLIEALTE